jgi:hypothetical protein
MSLARRLQTAVWAVVAALSIQSRSSADVLERFELA